MQKADGFLAGGCRFFLVVAEAGSIRAAARQINTAASAVSRQITLLEESLGIDLFERTGRKLRLSAAGEELQRALTASSLIHEQAIDRLNALRGLKSGRVRIAAVESISVSLLPRILEEFNALHPGVQLLVTVTGSDTVAALVRESAADVGFTFNPSSFEGLDVAHVMDLPLGAVVSPSHDMARSTQVSLKECMNHALAWPARGLSLRTLLDTLARRQKLQVKPALESNSLRIMASMAAHGIGVAFQTTIGIEQELSSGTLRFIPLADRGIPPDRMMLVNRPGLASQAAAAFLDLSRRRLPKLVPKLPPVQKIRTLRGK